MPPGPVVVHLDVFKYRPPHGSTPGEALAVDHLHLERVEEALGAGVIITVALAAHAANKAVLGQNGQVAPEQYWLPRSECMTRPREEWVGAVREDLRIVDQNLWARARAHQDEVAKTY